MASLLLAAGTPTMRFSLPHSRIMVHQPSGGAQVNIISFLYHKNSIKKIMLPMNTFIQFLPTSFGLFFLFQINGHLINIKKKGFAYCAI